MKLIAKESFEQGLPKKRGGTFKVQKDAEYPCESTQDGIKVTVDGVARALDQKLKDKLLALKYIELKD